MFFPSAPKFLYPQRVTDQMRVIRHLWTLVLDKAMCFCLSRLTCEQMYSKLLTVPLPGLQAFHEVSLSSEGSSLLPSPHNFLPNSSFSFKTEVPHPSSETWPLVHSSIIAFLTWILIAVFPICLSSSLEVLWWSKMTYCSSRCPQHFGKYAWLRVDVL